MKTDTFPTSRRYDLDWLRVLVFGLLIFYHVGMLFVADWGYHYKSQHQAEWLQSLMIFLNQWRLPLLFLISGIAIRFFLNKVALWRFVALRTFRLWVPLLFGIWVIVPPQLYIEMLSKGDLPDISYWQFYVAFFDLSHPYFKDYQSGIFPHVDVNHLWYIRELWYFSMYLLIIYAGLSVLRLMPYLYQPFKSWSITVIGILMVIGMSSIHFFLFPEDSEGRRKALGFSFMCLGFLMGWEKNFWQQVNHHRKALLLIAISSFTGLIIYYYKFFDERADSPRDLLYFFELLLVYLNRFAWILTILGFANHHLSKNHPCLKYLNEAVYPYYILHQTFIIVLAFWLSNTGPMIQPLLVIVLTFIGCAFCYEIIRRFKILRLLFGLKIGLSQPLKNT